MNTYKNDREDIQQNELDLVDIWLHVRRHYVAFLSGLFLCLVAGVLAVFLNPPRYEHKLVLEVGGMWIDQGEGDRESYGLPDSQFQYLEDPLTVQAKIEKSYALEEVLRTQETDSGGLHVNEITVEVAEKTGIIGLTVSADATRTPLIFTVFEGIATRVLEGHNRLLDKRVALLREAAEKRLEEIDQQLELLRSSRSEVAESGDAAAKGLTLLMVDSQVQELASEQSRIRRQLHIDLTINAQETRIITGPMRNPLPVGPGSILILSLAIIGGVIAGFAFVVVAVLAAEARQRSNG